MFTSLCGQKAMPNVVIATTMWDEVEGNGIGELREQELKDVFWKDMLANGCTTERFENTSESAWKIVGNVMQRKSRVPLRLQEEMVDEGKLLRETKTFEIVKESALPRWLADLVRKSLAR